MKTVAEVKNKNSGQILYVNGKAVSRLSYMVYYTEKACFDDFAKAGYNLFSIPVFFGTNTISEATHIPPISKGIFDTDTPDYSEFDKNVKAITDVCPDAYILPRVNVSPSREWEILHPDELNDTGREPFMECRRFCFASDIWADEVKRTLKLFNQHIENMPYAKNIIGYHLATGQTEEWMAFDVKGSRGKRSHEKFEKSGLEKNEVNYYRFLSDIIADRICEFSKYIKELTDGRLLTGAFYGYTFELLKRGKGHYSLNRVLDCPDVDFLCSPISYANSRKEGRDHGYIVPISSIQNAGKLYFAENDTRTHLSQPPNDLPHYNSPVWYGPDCETTINIMKMHFAKAITRGHSSWWFDMWGGWFKDKKYMSLLQKMQNISVESLEMSMKSVAEVAVFVDENSIFNLEDSDPAYKNVVYDIREALGKAAVPYDIYLASDFNKVKDNYKAIISLIPYPTDLSKQITGDALLEVTKDNFNITVDELREFYRNAGVHIYCEKQAVIYANESYLFFHSTEDGEYSIELPSDKKLFEVFLEQEYDSSLFKCAKGTSKLYKIKAE